MEVFVVVETFVRVVYIYKYSNWQLKCCDPWQLHKKTVAYIYLRTISEFEADTFNNLFKLSGELSVKPGLKLCYDCFNACSSSQSSVHSELSEQSQDEVDK